MKSKPNKNKNGLRIEYNPADRKDLELAKTVARYWHQRGALENRLIPLNSERIKNGEAA